MDCYQTSKWAKVVIYALLILASLICILPFVNLLATSFSSSTAVKAGQVTFWPVEFTTYSYEYALQGGKFVRALWQSVKLVVLGTATNLLVMVITAFPLSRSSKEFWGRNVYMGFFVVTMLVGGGLIPSYLVVVQMGLKNSIWALIIPGALPVSNMLILMNFIRGIPREIEEAAVIDGASPLKILIRVILPLIKPALATVCLFCMVGHWNNWFGGMIYFNDPNDYPLQTYMQSLLTNFEALMHQQNVSDFTVLLAKMNAQTGRAAQLFLGALPILLVYPFLQKYFTTGFVLGSVKG